MRLAFLYATRHHLRHLRRSLMTLFGIALGVSLIVSVSLVNRHILTAYAHLVDEVAGKAAVQVVSSARGGLNAEWLNQVRETEGVAAAVGVVNTTVPALKDGKRFALLLFGIDPEADRLVRDYTLSSGEWLAGGAGREIVTAQPIADRYGLKVGDTIELLTSQGLQKYRVSGILKPEGAGRVNLGDFVVLPLAQAQADFQRTGKVDEIHVVLKDGVATEKVMKALDVRLEGKALVRRTTDRGRDVEDMLASLRVMLGMASMIALFAGAFTIFNNMSVSFQERRRELGILLSLGLRRGRMIAQLMGEAALMGMLGAMGGIVMGGAMSVVMVQGVAETITDFYRITFSAPNLQSRDIVPALIVGVGVTVVAVVMATRELATLSPADAMKPWQGTTGSKGPSKLATVSGFVFLLGGLGEAAWLSTADGSTTDLPVVPMWMGSIFASLFGVSLVMPALLPLVAKLGAFLVVPLRSVALRLGVDNIGRATVRNGATISAVIVATAMMVGIGGQTASFKGSVQEWVNDTLRWDLLVTNSFTGTTADVDMPASLQEELAALPGVSLVSPEKFAPAFFRDGTSVAIWAFEFKDFARFANMNVVEGQKEGLFDRLARGDSAAISSTFAARMGYKVGDKLEFHTPEGKLNLSIIATVQDFGSDLGAVYVDASTYRDHWKDEGVSAYAIVLEDRSKISTVKEQIESRWGDKWSLSARTRGEFMSRIDEMADQAFSLTNGLVWVAVLVGVFGVVNTLLIAVSERQPEIGVLQAVGARPGVVRNMVVLEALVMGVVSVAEGVSFGYLIRSALIAGARNTTGMILSPHWPDHMAFSILVIALVLVPVASLFPAMIATRVPLTQAMRYE